MKLEKLIQDKSGELSRPDGASLRAKHAVPKGILRTITIESPCFNIPKALIEMAERDPNFVPEGANAYLVSEFDEGTRHLRKVNSNGDKKSYSVYALQFYHVYPPIKIKDD